MVGKCNSNRLKFWWGYRFLSFKEFVGKWYGILSGMKFVCWFEFVVFVLVFFYKYFRKMRLKFCGYVVLFVFFNRW